MPRMQQSKARIFLILMLSSWAGTSLAQARLDCKVTYAGLTHEVSAQPVINPYNVPSVDIGGRFQFKPVLVGQGADVQRALVYVYFLTARQPVLIQQAKYLPPFAASNTGRALELTGEQYLYAGTQERELIYTCTLQGVQP